MGDGKRSQYPCTIPSVQIDLWGQKKHKKTHSVTELARTIMQTYEHLMCWSLLRVRHADTITKIADCIHLVNQPLAPRVGHGQVYLQHNWRIRWEDMCPAVHEVVLGLAEHSTQELVQAFNTYYDVRKIEARIYSIIGPARAAGARSTLRWRQTAFHTASTAA